VICEEACLHIGADPHASSTELREHLERCDACRHYQCAMGALDVDLRKALSLGPALPAREEPRQQRRAARAPRTGFWAIAASVLLALAVGLLLWTARPPDSLARDVGAHLALEPASWTRTEVLSGDAIDAVLRAAHVELVGGQDRVVFARTCFVHGHWVPHLVVRMEQGPVAVVILPDEPVKSPQAFHESGFTGILLPAPGGSIAVLTQQDALSTQVAQQVSGAVHWLRNEPASR
jgi:hypothetical protein